MNWHGGGGWVCLVPHCVHVICCFAVVCINFYILCAQVTHEESARSDFVIITKVVSPSAAYTAGVMKVRTQTAKLHVCIN